MKRLIVKFFLALLLTALLARHLLLYVQQQHDPAEFIWVSLILLLWLIFAMLSLIPDLVGEIKSEDDSTTIGAAHSSIDQSTAPEVAKEKQKSEAALAEVDAFQAEKAKLSGDELIKATFDFYVSFFAAFTAVAYRQKEGKWKVTHTYALAHKEDTLPNFYADEGLVGKVMQSKKAFFVKNKEIHQSLAKLAQSGVGAAEVGALTYLPIINESAEVLAVVEMGLMENGATSFKKEALQQVLNIGV